MQACPRGLSADELVDFYRTREPRDPDRVQRFDLDEPLHQAEGLGRQPDGPGRHELFQLGGEIRRLTDGGVFHVQVVADGAHHHLAGVEAGAELYLDPVRTAELFGVLADGLLHGECRVTGPSRVVLVGQWRAEQRHHPVAQRRG